MASGSAYDWLNPSLPDVSAPDVESCAQTLAEILFTEKIRPRKHQPTFAIGLELLREDINLIRIANMFDVSEKTARKLLLPYRNLELVDVKKSSSSLYFHGNEHLGLVMRRTISLMPKARRRRIFNTEPALANFEPFVGLWTVEKPRDENAFRVADRAEARIFYGRYSGAARAVFDLAERYRYRGAPPVMAILYHLTFAEPLSTGDLAERARGSASDISKALKLLKTYGVIAMIPNPNRRLLSDPWKVWDIAPEARLLLPTVYSHLSRGTKTKCLKLQGISKILEIIET